MYPIYMKYQTVASIFLFLACLVFDDEDEEK